MALMLSAQETPDGLKGKVYYISALTRLPDFDRLESVGTIYTNRIDIGPTNSEAGYPGIPDRHGWFAIDYTGKIYIREPGEYYFELVSDDGAKFYIDGTVMIDNDHGLGDWTGRKTIRLTGGMHRIRLSYFQGPANHHCIELRLSVTPPKGRNTRVFDTWDFNPPTRPEDWKYGSPADFEEPPDTNISRVRLKDVIATQDGASIGELLAVVRSGMGKHTSDKSLARSLDKLTLKEKLDSTTIEELQSEGAGPETVAGLERLSQISTGLPLATGTPAFQFPPRPSIDEQTQFFRQVTGNAMHYTASLPDFICTEMIRRFTAPAQPIPATTLGPAHKPTPEVWKPQDVLTVKLTYFKNHEDYQLALVNGHKTPRGYESAGGAIFKGDFGTQLLEIFAPDTKTKFQWDHWTRLRNRLTHVYSYRTIREHSNYKLTFGVKGEYRQTVIAGRHGFMYADNETHMVMRITGEAESIPPGFPVIAASSILDYDLADVGGRQFLLPLRSEQQMKDAQREFKNVEEFRDYRKFVGESTITFDAPAQP